MGDVCASLSSPAAPLLLEDIPFLQHEQRALLQPSQAIGRTPCAGLALRQFGLEDLQHIPQGWRVMAMLSQAKGFICLTGCTSGVCLAEREAKQQWQLWWP